MAWNSEITQYVGWNFNGDSLEVEMRFMLQGIGADSGYLIDLGNSNLSAPKWSNAVPKTVKYGHPFFVYFLDVYDIDFGYTGWMYNENPIFRNNSSEMIFKSRSGDWVHSKTGAEPYLFLSSSTALFDEDILPGSYVTDLTSNVVNPNKCYRCKGDTPESKLTQSTTEEYSFYNYSNDLLETFYAESPNWTMSATPLLHEENNKQFVSLSSYLGIYEAPMQFNVVVGTGFWQSSNASVHGYNGCMMFEWISEEDSTKSLQALLKKNNNDDWEIVDLLGSSSLLNPRIDSAVIELGSTASIQFSDGAKAYHASMPWAGFGIGDDRGSVRYAQMPWYRQEEEDEEEEEE